MRARRVDRSSDSLPPGNSKKQTNDLQVPVCPCRPVPPSAVQCRPPLPIRSIAGTADGCQQAPISFFDIFFDPLPHDEPRLIEGSRSRYLVKYFNSLLVPCAFGYTLLIPITSCWLFSARTYIPFISWPILSFSFYWPLSHTR